MFDAVYISHAEMFGKDEPIKWVGNVCMRENYHGIANNRLRAIQHAATLLVPGWVSIPSEFRRPIIQVRGRDAVQGMVSLTHSGPDGGTGYVVHPYMPGIRANVEKWQEIQSGAWGGVSESPIIAQADKLVTS